MGEYISPEKAIELADNILLGSRGNHTSSALSLPLIQGSTGYDSHQRWLVKGLLPEDATVCLYGQSGTFKSFLALSWACHIATGGDWDGRKAKPGCVLYIAGEGQSGALKRIRAWEIYQNNQQLLKKLFTIPQPVYPASPDHCDAIQHTCKKIKADTNENVSLIILDTLARCYGGNDENSAKDMGAFIAGIDQIRADTGATVLVIHHSGKNEQNGARGSSALRAALDVEFKVNREDDNSLLLSCTKMKDADPPETTAYDLEHVNVLTDEDGEQVSSLVVSPYGRSPPSKGARLSGERITENHQAVYKAIQIRIMNDESPTRATIRNDLKTQGIDLKNFGRWIKKLVDDGMLTLDGDALLIPSQAPITGTDISSPK